MLASSASSARASRRLTSSSTVRGVSEWKNRFRLVAGSVIDVQLSQSEVSDLYAPVYMAESGVSEWSMD